VLLPVPGWQVPLLLVDPQVAGLLPLLPLVLLPVALLPLLPGPVH
jgi:hypothetical protein